MPNVTNVTSTMGFVDLNDLYDDEIVTTVDLGLLEDAVKAAQAIESGSTYQDVQVHLVHAQEGTDNPAIALSTSHSRPMAAMVASVLHPEENDNDDA